MKPSTNMKPSTREELRSDEELFFIAWLEECLANGLITNWLYEPVEYPLLDAQTITIRKELKTKTKTIKRHLFRPTVYTPDFKVCLTFDGDIAFEKIFAKSIIVNPKVLWIDVKGGYNPHGGDERYFSLKQKLMYERHKIYVSKVVPDKLFKNTFVPEILRWKKKTIKPILRKKYANCKTIKEFIR